MSEKKLIEALTAVCEWAKSESVGFEWLTHEGHWRRPEIIAVFKTEKQKKAEHFQLTGTKHSNMNLITYAPN